MSYEIVPAKNGGYIVIVGRGGYYDPGVPREILLAGTLEQCLTFVRDQFSKPAE